MAGRSFPLPHTAAVIQPAFYRDLPFTSARPPRHILLRGSPLAELSTELVTPLGGPGDPLLTAAAANRVTDLVTCGRVVGASGDLRVLLPHDLGVITPHVEQAAAVAAD